MKIGRLSRYVFASLLFISVTVRAGEARGAAMLVDSKAIKEHFAGITDKDMELLRSKNILFASRSFGLNLWNGLTALAKQDKKYDILSSYERFDVFKAGGNLATIPADAFQKTKFVHFLCTYWPHTKRVEEMDTLLHQPPHNFGKTVDAVIIFYHTALPDAFDTYSKKMDAWRAEFPNVRFIYVTSGFMADSRAKENENSHAFGEKVRAKYKGAVTIYDMAAILSDDFRAGHAYCPEYSKDPAGVHPNLPAGETMMAKGFLLALRDAFKQQGGGKPAAAPGGGKDTEPVAATLPATHPDAKAVRAILDANNLKEKKVESVSVVKNGRIVSLFLQEGGIVELTDAIGALTELEVLHVYGDRNLPHPLLKKISPAIGNCTKLQDLLLNNNELTTLPAEIAKLQKLTSLSLADNKLADLPPAVAAWAKKFDPKGMEQQAAAAK